MVAAVLLWLFVIDLGIVCGAGLYEARITVPRWLSATGWDAEAARQDDVGRRFWALPTTLAMTLLTLANGWIALGQTGRSRELLGTAALLALVERVLTFGYFIPTMVSLQRAADPVAALPRARRWARLNVVRLGLVIAAWLAALRAFAAS